MKSKDLLNELRQLTRGDLESRLEELRRDLLKLRLEKVSNPPKDFVSKKHYLKSSIARCLTLLNSE